MYVSTIRGDDLDLDSYVCLLCSSVSKKPDTDSCQVALTMYCNLSCFVAIEILYEYRFGLSTS